MQKRTLVAVATMLTVARTAFAVPLYSDDFNRADGALGAAWPASGFGAAPTISSNQACSGPAGEGVALYGSTVDPAFAVGIDIDFTATVADTMKLQTIPPRGRITDQRRDLDLPPVWEYQADLQTVIRPGTKATMDTRRNGAMEPEAAPLYPNDGAFLIKFHRDALGTAGDCVGRIEHLLSGNEARFATCAEIFDFVSRILGRPTEGFVDIDQLPSE